MRHRRPPADGTPERPCPWRGVSRDCLIKSLRLLAVVVQVWEAALVVRVGLVLKSAHVAHARRHTSGAATSHARHHARHVHAARAARAATHLRHHLLHGRHVHSTRATRSAAHARHAAHAAHAAHARGAATTEPLGTLQVRLVEGLLLIVLVDVFVPVDGALALLLDLVLQQTHPELLLLGLLHDDHLDGARQALPLGTLVLRVDRLEELELGEVLLAAGRALERELVLGQLNLLVLHIRESDGHVERVRALRPFYRRRERV
mmetsp:Transcript_25470/g.52698  ORF Transcript_25470/g.52698 Transcript_25470/m.52698 type:complete len:262 (-) Transcript_25470:42-827(-)